MGRKSTNGGKINASHGSRIESVEVILRTANNDDHTYRISLGMIKGNARRRQRRLKFSETTSGWKITVYSPTSLQELYIYSSNPLVTRELLTNAFKAEYVDAQVQ